MLHDRAKPPWLCSTRPRSVPWSVFLAPEWLVHAAPAIALLAMLISLASFVLALKTYRRAGARVRVEYEVGTVTDNRLEGDEKVTPAIAIHITNSGMNGISIDGFLLRPPTIIGFLRTGPYLLFDENSKDSDVERIAGKKLPVSLRSNRSMDWLYRIKDAGLAEGWGAEGSNAERPRMVTGLPEVYGRIRKSVLEVRLGNGRTVKKVNLTYGAVISLGEYVVDDEP